jgi:hypothetical protein
MFGRPKSARIEFTIDNKAKTEVAYEIDDQQFKLKPGVARTHSYCRPPQVVVQLGDERQKSLKPASDEIFAVVSREGELQVEKRAQ